MEEREERRTYTEDDIERILSKRMSEVELEQIKRRIKIDEDHNAEIFSEIRTTLRSLDTSVNDASSRLFQTRKELREEIEIDFVTKTVFNLELQRLETLVQTQWQKITLAVTITMIVVQFGFQFLQGVVL